MHPRVHTQPRLAEANLRRLADLAKHHGVSMTDVLNLIVATALEDLEQAPTLCDDGDTRRSPRHGRARQHHTTQGRHHGTAGHAPSRAHDRHRVPPTPSTRHRTFLKRRTYAGTPGLGATFVRGGV